MLSERFVVHLSCHLPYLETEDIGLNFSWIVIVIVIVMVSRNDPPKCVHLVPSATHLRSRESSLDAIQNMLGINEGRSWRRQRS